MIKTDPGKYKRSPAGVRHGVGSRPSESPTTCLRNTNSSVGDQCRQAARIVKPGLRAQIGGVDIPRRNSLMQRNLRAGTMAEKERNCGPSVFLRPPTRMRPVRRYYGDEEQSEQRPQPSIVDSHWYRAGQHESDDDHACDACGSAHLNHPSHIDNSS